MRKLTVDMLGSGAGDGDDNSGIGISRSCVPTL